MIGAGFGLALIYLMQSDKKAPTSSASAGNSQIDFVRKYYKFAQAAGKMTGVPGLVTLTFAAIESGYGKHAPGNNFFGIKAGSDWHGSIQKLKTAECFPEGNKTLKSEIIRVCPRGSSCAFKACTKRGEFTYWIYAKFRAYSSPAAAFIDYGLFVKKRWPRAFNEVTAADFGAYILEHGYATGKYADSYRRLVALFQQVATKYNL